MRVLYFSPAGCLGGAERSLLTLLSALQPIGGITAGLISAADGPLVEESRALGIHTSVLPWPRRLGSVGEFGGPMRALVAGLAASVPAARYVPQLRRALTDWQPDILHTNGIKAHLLGAVAKPRRTALVWHVHDYVSGRRISPALLAAAAPSCRRAVAVSESVARDLRRAIPGISVSTIENGVDLSRFTPEGPAADLDALAGVAAPNPGVVRVGLVATYARWKGHEVFLRAIARLADPRLQAYIVGGPVYDTSDSQWSQQELRHLVSGHRAGHQVRFVPFVRDIAPVMRSLDVVVHASTRPEPFGLTIAEAMCCGRAVIVSRAGGAADLVQPEVDGLVHEPGDDAGLASAVARLAASAVERRRLGEAAARTGRTRFDAARTGRQMADLYRTLMPLASRAAEAVALR